MNKKFFEKKNIFIDFSSNFPAISSRIHDLDNTLVWNKKKKSYCEIHQSMYITHEVEVEYFLFEILKKY